MIRFKISWDAEKKLAVDYLKDLSNKKQLEHWQKGTLADHIIVVATGRKNNKYFPSNKDIIYRPYDYSLSPQKRVEVPEIIVLFEPKDYQGNAKDIAVRFPSVLSCPVRESSTQLLDAILSADEKYFGSGGVLYSGRAMHIQLPLISELIRGLYPLYKKRS